MVKQISSFGWKPSTADETYIRARCQHAIQHVDAMLAVSVPAVEPWMVSTKNWLLCPIDTPIDRLSNYHCHANNCIRAAIVP